MKIDCYGLLPEKCNNLKINIIKKDDYIDNIIEIADAIEAYCYCSFQVHLGNKDFIKKLEITNNNIQDLSAKYNYVKYFIDNIFNQDNFEIIY
nr:hypothetical protein [Clostridiales bacterium]